MKSIKTKLAWLLAVLLAGQANVFSQCTGTRPPCDGGIYNIDYSNPFIWQQVHQIGSSGKMLVAGGVMNYMGPGGGDYNRMYLPITNLYNNDIDFVAETQITITEGSYAPGHYVMAFTSNSNDPLSVGPPTYSRTNNNALAVVITTQNSQLSGANPCAAGKNWYFQAMSKLGSDTPAFSTPIPVGDTSVSGGCQMPQTFYIRIIRYQNWVMMAVFKNALFTVHVPGSPVCMTVPVANRYFRHIQHGVVTWSNQVRKLNMTLDNTKICRYVDSFQEPGAGDAPNSAKENKSTLLEPGLKAADYNQYIQISPNPSPGSFKVDVHRLDEKIERIAIYDLTGKVQKTVEKIGEEVLIPVNANELKTGVYMVEAYSKTKVWKTSVVIQQ